MFSDSASNEESIENIFAFVFIPLFLMTVFIVIFLIISKFLYLKGVKDSTVEISEIPSLDLDSDNLRSFIL
uniref:Small integral membrane protein 15 (inferred by orthology to a human protein) n=1 Tax=Strongyloides venezuelensis TaxID=75913 RepID=A0A0K0FJD7_STRVS